MKLMNKINGYIFYGKFKDISRFSLVGVVNTLVDFCMFTVFNGVIGVGYEASQVIGYSFGVINSFIFNKKWTFQKRKVNKKILYEFIEFILVNLISLIVTVVIIKLLVKNFNMNVYLAKLIVTIIAQLINFLAYKFLVFK